MSTTKQKFLINLGVGLVIAAVIIFAGGVFSQETASDVLRVVCDGFFVAGAVLLAFGGLKWSSNGGAVDGLGYSMKMVQRRLFPFFRKPEEERETFAEYRERREAKATSPKPLLLAGLVYFVIALILFGVYNFV